jgi:hypothetical protein
MMVSGLAFLNVPLGLFRLARNQFALLRLKSTPRPRAIVLISDGVPSTLYLGDNPLKGDFHKSFGVVRGSVLTSDFVS